MPFTSLKFPADFPILALNFTLDPDLISFIPMSRYFIIIQQFLGTLVSYLPQLAVGIGLWFVGNWVIDRFIKFLKVILAGKNFDISLESFLLNLASIGLKVMLGITVASQLGIQTTLFVTILGAISLAVGLALQGTLANFAGGVLILIFRPFKVDDYIEAQGQAGKVTEIQIFNTLLLANNSKTIVIPNGILSNGTIVNHSHMGTLLFEIKIEVDRSADLDQIRSLLIPIMDSDPRILKDPKPGVGVSGFGNGYFLNINGHTESQNQLSVIASLNEKIAKIFSEHKIPGPETHNYIHTIPSH